ncbi:mannose/fructose/N-acetylgalactosamine-specific phosphotransferase system component IIB [Clostridium beijerinckii]|nr:mannose/fructose/N-acetylgalactosamine-specific phosphotransferase system component IIB [Clostridium beijerinckii]
MPNILMTRIDNRLVHGQVGVTWTTSLGANLLVVVDDTAASDPVQQQLMSMTAESSGVGIRFFTIQKNYRCYTQSISKPKDFYSM